MLHKDVDKATHNLRHLEELAAHSLNELQRMIADLRPSHLDDLGLSAALRWYTGEIQSRAPLEIGFEVAGEPREIEPALKTTLFRLAQEALTNVVKHAAADHAQVRLNYGRQVVTLCVEDDGCGFEVDGLARPDRHSWGLLGMEERASLLGGQLNLYSRPGEGTRVEVHIPYDNIAEDNHDNKTAIGG